MLPFSLSKAEQVRLNDLLNSTRRSNVYRRVQALLWLDEGWGIQDVARTLHVSRFTVSNWRDRYLERQALPLIERLSDAPRSGRPRRGEGRIDSLVEEVIDTDPRELGYQATTWTAPLLALYLKDFHLIEVVPRTVGRALDRLDICWKRPRHALAARSSTWRQAKGG